jgi:protein-S-isoprenylcysteine O-methyltransferase Ste14
MAWAYLGVSVANVVFSLVFVMPRSPDLMAERSKMQEGTKAWDKVLAPLAAVGSALGTMVVAGLDYRLGWTPEVPLWGVLVGLGLVLGACVLINWAMYVNRFFAATVRIQQDRGHTVCTDGPYQYVRHPGYAGWVLLATGQPLMLGSLWALIVTFVTFALIVIRTWLEDDTLAEELEGYAEYRQQVRHRLIPGVW